MPRNPQIEQELDYHDSDHSVAHQETSAAMLGRRRQTVQLSELVPVPSS
jgi:hypothetical protein